MVKPGSREPGRASHSESSWGDLEVESGVHRARQFCEALATHEPRGDDLRGDSTSTDGATGQSGAIPPQGQACHGLDKPRVRLWRVTDQGHEGVGSTASPSLFRKTGQDQGLFSPGQGRHFLKGPSQQLPRD